MMISPNEIGYREYNFMEKAISVITFLAYSAFILFMIVLVNV